MKKETITLVYVGRRVLASNKKLGFKYENIKTKETMLFKSKLHGLETIGKLLQVQQKGDSVYKPYKYLGPTKNCYQGYGTYTKTDVDKWVLRDRVIYDEFQMNKEIKKPLPVYYDHAIDNLRFLYRECSPSQKQIFINRLIKDIVK